MAFVISLEDYRPGQRYDDEPWTGADMKHSATQDGSYALVESFVFADPDEDPTDPKTRNFTTALSPAAAGWFKIIFTRGAEQQPADPVYFPDPGMRPSLEDVGALLWARTKDNAGNMLGTFDENTRPTGVQAERIIDTALADVAMRVSEDIPPNLYDSAREAVSLRAAQLIELSFQPEQTEDRMTAYQALRLTYEEVVARLVSIVSTRALFAEVEPAEPVEAE